MAAEHMAEACTKVQQPCSHHPRASIVHRAMHDICQLVKAQRHMHGVGHGCLQGHASWTHPVNIVARALSC
jgi:hypothetical protein